MAERLAQDSGVQVYTGSELLLKGALEGGVALITGYPGSPLADFFDLPSSRQRLLDEAGIVFQMANNEALAAARLNGSQMADLRAMAVMKSVGAHVASDGLALGNLAKHGYRGGAIAVIGDDPWNESTQVPADSRFMAQHLHMPVVEPSTFQELKDWVQHAFDLSATSNLLVTYLVTTNQADGGGTVRVHPNRRPTINRKEPIALDPSTLSLDESVILPPRTSQQEATLDARFAHLLDRARALGLNQLFRAEGTGRVGFVTSGMAYCYLAQALDRLGLFGRVPILKLGVSYPVDPELARELAALVDDVIVVEEKRAFLETQITQILKDQHQAGQLPRLPRIWGKQFPEGHEGFPHLRGLNPSIVLERLGALVDTGLLSTNGRALAAWRREQQGLEATQRLEVQLPKRTPTFCPGCPHRDSSNVMLDIQRSFRDAAYMQRRHHQGPVDLIFHGDTGCYTMLMFEPNASLMHNYSGMGLGGGTGAGIDPFITNKQVVFMGDGTFFHGGMVAISDSIKHHQDITYVILDNKTTAMTGHQPTPSVEFDVMGHATAVQNIEAILRAMAQGTPVTVERANPAYHQSYREMLEATILLDGVKVVIADKECGITFHRRQRKVELAEVRREGFLAMERHINITPEVCEYCLECTKATGCPGLTIIDTPYGRKIATDQSNCVADKACTQQQVCPSFEEVIVRRVKPPRAQPAAPTAAALPDVPARAFDEAWNAYIAGVGGMGIGVITAVLVRAGMREGLHVQFSDRKGLAIRNGGVYSYLTFLKQDKPISPIIPYGCADLLMGMDIIEAVRSIDPQMNFRIAHPERTTTLINTFHAPTIGMLVGKDEPVATERLEEWLRAASRDYVGLNVSEISEERFGNRLYANIIVLGLAYQRGLLPLTLSSLESSLDASVPADDRAVNREAFSLGRQLALQPAPRHATQESLEDVLRTKVAVLTQTCSGSRVAAQYQALVQQIQRECQLPQELLAALARRVADLIEYENLAYAQRYLHLVRRVYERDTAAWGWQATAAAIWYAHKVMAIKDEVYVAHLLTSPEKLLRDRQRYKVDPANGDRLEYVHLNRPQFTLFGRDITFSLKTRNWQLRLMRRAKFLRRWLPQWHRREKAFRDWYLSVALEFRYHDRASYDRYVEVLRLPEEVRGYRDIRYPAMDEARRAAEHLLAQLDPPASSSSDDSTLMSAQT